MDAPRDHSGTSSLSTRTGQRAKLHHNRQVGRQDFVAAAEGVIGAFRRERLDHLVISDERALAVTKPRSSRPAGSGGLERSALRQRGLAH